MSSRGNKKGKGKGKGKAVEGNRKRDGVYDDGSDSGRIKRQKMELLEAVLNPQDAASRGQPAEASGASLERDICMHHAVVGRVCFGCGKTVVAFGYINERLWLSHDEIARIRDEDLKSLLHRKKLYLVLDLDETLLNSIGVDLISDKDIFLKNQQVESQDRSMMIKLRPFVHTFLKEASSLFHMYIYTLGRRLYALEMLNLLDPGDVYFHSKVIAKENSTKKHLKGLDVLLAQEIAVLILDDNKEVWEEHEENLILIERYDFFTKSLEQFGYFGISLAEQEKDENEVDGALAIALRVLKRIHSAFSIQHERIILWTEMSGRIWELQMESLRRY